jgi:hypothetical protein
MPEYFWEWYKQKGYINLLSEEDCFKNTAFLIGCCIEYLTEKGQKITNLNNYNDLKDIVNYLKTGVAWTT